ncbi:hypothetical protein WOLCODRAFT_27023, partial [Wolfiporia cocos MD-104 SS10]
MKAYLPSLLSGVETLALHNITCLGGLEALRSILLACSRLSHLYLGQVYFPEDTRWCPTYGATVDHKETIRTLVCAGREGCAPFEGLLQWLTHGGLNVNLSRLGISGMTDNAWDILHIAGDSLEYLWIDLRETVRPRVVAALARNTRLVAIDLIGVDML